MPNFIVVALKVWASSQNRKSPKMVIWYNLPPMGKSWDPEKYLNICTQLQTFFYAMAPYMYLLKQYSINTT